MNKEKDNPQQQMQDLFSQMVSQTSGMFSPMDPLGAMKPLQQVAEAWTKNPQQFTDAMQDWTQQIGDMNTRIWQDFLDRQKENDPRKISRPNSRTFPTSPGFASITKLTRTGWSSKFGIPVVFLKKSKRMRVSGPSKC